MAMKNFEKRSWTNVSNTIIIMMMIIIIIIIIIIIQLFIIYVPSQQPKGQLQTQHSLDTDNYIIGKHKLQAGTGGK
jgi:hypothetical protein